MSPRKKVTRKKPADVPVSAPVPKPTDGRPSLADAKALAKASAKTQQAASDRPGAVMNGEAGLEYYYWDALEVDEAYQVKLRVLLGQKGYWKTDGDEYVGSVPHAEIWATYAEVKKELDKATAKRHRLLKQRVAGKMT